MVSYLIEDVYIKGKIDTCLIWQMFQSARYRRPEMKEKVILYIAPSLYKNY